jgi:DNA uptake protein ComE-like DNA-binding protein
MWKCPRAFTAFLSLALMDSMAVAVQITVLVSGAQEWREFGSPVRRSRMMALPKVIGLWLAGIGLRVYPAQRPGHLEARSRPGCVVGLCIQAGYLRVRVPSLTGTAGLDVPMAVDPRGSGTLRVADGGASRRWATGASFLWAATPVLTAGFGTPAVFLYAAIRLRSAWLGVASALYAGLLAVFLVAIGGPGDPGPSAGAIGIVAWLGCMLGGSAHALAIRGRVVSGRRARVGDSLRRAEREVAERRKLRQVARAIAARDPVLARELGIGRPDLQREFDDGGLVDVNRAPAAVISTLPGMTAALAAEAVALRRERGAFVSADDLSVSLGMPPEYTADVADRTIYLP